MPETTLNGKTQDFVSHVRMVAQKVAETLPELNGRMQRAMDLIYTGAAVLVLQIIAARRKDGWSLEQAPRLPHGD